MTLKIILIMRKYLVLCASKIKIKEIENCRDSRQKSIKTKRTLEKPNFILI